MKCVLEHLFTMLGNSLLHSAAAIKIDSESALLAICVLYFERAWATPPPEKILSSAKAKHLIRLEMLHTSRSPVWGL